MSGTKPSETIVASACQHDCPDNCAMLTTVRNGKVVSVTGRKNHPFTQGVLCSKVRSFDKRVYSPDRILHPLRRVGPKGKGQFERTTWTSALTQIGERFNAIIQSDGAEAILPFNYLGSQGLLNGMHCGDPFFNRLGATLGERTFCNSGASKAFRMVCGPTGGLDPESFAHSDLIILWGINTVATSMHHWRFVKQAKQRGAKLIVIDPLRSETAAQADWHIRPRPGSDSALALAIIHQIFHDDSLDHDYVAQYTQGVDGLRERARQYPPDVAAGITGLAQDDITQLAREYAKARASAIRTGVALERTRNGPDAVRAIACLPALTGAWREVGGGMFQHPHQSFPIQRDRLTRPDLGDSGRRAINLFGLSDALRPDAASPVKSLFVFNANPVTASADQEGIVRGLLRDDLFTVVSEIFPTDTTDYADLVLPACSQLEQLDLMYSWGHFNLQINQPAIDPLGESVSNTELFRRLSQTMGFTESDLQRSDAQLAGDALDWQATQLDGTSLSSLSSTGFTRLNLGSPATRRPHARGNFPTPSGKCEFESSIAADGASMLEVYRQGVPDPGSGAVDPLPGYQPTSADDLNEWPFQLLSPKTQHLLNSGYANLTTNGKQNDSQPVWIHPDDADCVGIADGERVVVSNRLGTVPATARITTDTLPGVLVITHGYWRKHTGAATVNTLVSHQPANIGRAPTINDSRVTIRRAGIENNIGIKHPVPQ